MASIGHLHSINYLVSALQSHNVPILTHTAMPIHDITICSGDGCSIKAFCHRYQVYKSIPKGHNDLVSHTDPKDCIDNNKQLFWKETT